MPEQSNQQNDRPVNAQTKSVHAEREERILSFWKEKEIFEESVEKNNPKGDYTFYDGPPFATGLPHYGNILAGTIKDVMPRFKTMQGYRVRRRWGWDCHGLPVENIVEKELGLKAKKDIVDYGIGKFNEKARESVMRYADEWRRIVPRLGRWVDMDDDYRTMDASYTESVWWIFKQLYDEGLIYEGFKSMNLCPHCGTTLSNFEVAQGYKDITDISVYVKFKIKKQEAGRKENGDTQDTYLLAWTTTPWTLPGNVALAVGVDVNYVKIKIIDSIVTPAKAGVQNDKYNMESTILDSRSHTTTAPLAKLAGCLRGNDKTEFFILAKSRLVVLKDKKYEVMETFKGSKLVGLSYKPPFDYYSKNSTLKNRENAWKIYGADFVTTEDGTGIVHIAPAFGADDYELSLKHDLPFIQHVGMDGKFKDDFARGTEGVSFAGMNVKPRDTDEDKNLHQKTDIEIIKWLAHHDFLFEKEKLIHPYPHCWRCHTPLLNYATSSWFVKVTEIKDKLVAENNKITWVPPEVGSARFGNWLEGARDWAISRSRFWGAPIPVWREVQGEDNKEKNESQESHGKYHVIGSVEDLKKYSKAKNTYWVMRHGEADNNIKLILNGGDRNACHLTEKGKNQVLQAVKQIKDAGVDLVYVSPFARAQETAELLKGALGWKDGQIIIEDRIHEITFGAFEGKLVDELSKQYPFEQRFERMPDGAETYAIIKKRMGDFLYDVERKNENKNILIITHATPAMMLLAAARGIDREKSVSLEKGEYIGNAEVKKVDFSPLPHNAEYELDLHRPFIDDIELKTAEGNKLVRVPDVFDCWFESGSMPYGAAHYPFENPQGRPSENEDGSVRFARGLPAGEKSNFEPKSGLFKKSRGYPADFIAEGLDQTRGWFYSMLVLGVALFGKTPYKKVIVNGLVLAEDGQKMSKSKQNYPDPMLIVDKYGADSLRYYMLASPVVHGQDLRFSEKGVDEVTKKLVNRLLNVVSFYEMYVPAVTPAKAGVQNGNRSTESTVLDPSSHATTTPLVKLAGCLRWDDTNKNVLDQWISSRLNETIGAVTAGLEIGELDRAARPLMDLTDDLSTWYIRRSRDRFKGDDEADKQAALDTTRFVLQGMAKLLAPFMPFLAEDIHGRILQLDNSVQKSLDGKVVNKEATQRVESVHLEAWPAAGKIDNILIENMKVVRDLASKGLEARMSAKVNVRQPLKTLKVKIGGQLGGHLSTQLGAQFVDLIKDEVNVKEVVFGAPIETDVQLDVAITPDLKEEGMVRELIRAIQDLRKEKGLSVNDKATLMMETSDVGQKFIEKNKGQLMAVCTISEVKFGGVTVEGVTIGDILFKVKID